MPGTGIRLDTWSSAFLLRPLLTIVRLFVFFLFAACAIPSAHATAEDEIQQQLEQARSDLADGKATEARIASELNALKQSGKATPERIRDYELYLSRVQAMVAENQKIVDEMEKACARRQGAGKTGGCAPSAGSSPAAMPPGTEIGNLDTLDRKLNDSLSEFDQMLLKEMDAIRARSESRMRTLAQEAAAAAGKVGEGGGESATEPGASPAGKEGAEEGREEGGASAGGKAGSTESGGSYENVPVTDGPVEGATTAGSKPSDQQAKRPSGSDQDDDIVARQLREAAEKETDPELKKKLWKEYEDYKKASRQ
jgi:hypothetical protein